MSTNSSIVRPRKYHLAQLPLPKGFGGAGVHRTDIEWCDYAVGGIVRAMHPETGKPLNMCVPVSEGCRNCYAAAITNRFHSLDYSAQNAKAVRWFLDEKALRHALKFKAKGPFKRGRERPAIFFGDMTDPFGEWVTDEWLDRQFAVMALRPDVDFLLLTKRPERMAEYLNAGSLKVAQWADAAPRDKQHEARSKWRVPLPNVWLGTSVERQKEADERIPHLLKCPASVRFLSCEPLMGAVDLTRVNFGVPGIQNVLDCRVSEIAKRAGIDKLNGIDWVIVGGESGPGARPCDVAWIRSIVSQCRAADTACFVKQLGARPVVRHCGDCDPCIHGQPCPYGGPEQRVILDDTKGGTMEEWPEDLRVREFPEVAKRVAPE